MAHLEAVDLTPHFLELIRKTSCEMPADVVSALQRASEVEASGSSARGALETILQNIELAKTSSAPVCQDTGTPNFYVQHPTGFSTAGLTNQIKEALREATRKSYMRPNAVDPLTEKNSGDNTGINFPTINFTEWDHDHIQVDLVLKGGGSENVGAQYSLPDSSLKAGRDMKGVARVALHAVYKAQGQGCSPGVLGIAIGGDRATSYIMSKKQLLRKLDDVNPDPMLAKLELEILTKANTLDIGPMGFGGKTTLFGVKIGALHRLPACYFVSVTYMCWADRRHTMVWKNGEVTFD